MPKTPASVTLNHQTDEPLRAVHWLALGLGVVLFVALRLAWVGHLLVWDEAITLCTVRTFASGGQDIFSHWFWFHPPLHSLALSLLAPLQSGFAERAELLNLAIGVVNIILLFRLNRRLFGAPTAIGSVFFLAVMPGAIFFDVWIKADPLVATFGLLSLNFLIAGRIPYAGLALGLAFFAKETAMFYAIGIFFLWLCGAAGARRWREGIALVVIPILTSGWYFLLEYRGLAANLMFGVKQSDRWVHPWYYYLQQFPILLGALGMLLSLAGVALLLGQLRPRRSVPGFSTARLWPLAILVPSYALTSVIANKAPWLLISLWPAWATLQAVAVAWIISLVSNRAQPGVSLLQARVVRAVLIPGIVAASLAPVICRDYESTLRDVDAGQWNGATLSRETAEVMNRLVKDGQRILITSFQYWQGGRAGDPCPVFVCYFTRKADVLVRSHETSFEELAKDIREHHLDWALLAPTPGPKADEVFGGFMTRLGLKPIRLYGAYIFKTSDLHPEPAQP